MVSLLAYAQQLPLQAAAETEESDNPLLAISPGLMTVVLPGMAFSAAGSQSAFSPP